MKVLIFTIVLSVLCVIFPDIRVSFVAYSIAIICFLHMVFCTPIDIVLKNLKMYKNCKSCPSEKLCPKGIHDFNDTP
jgi:hypothetical protein